MKTRNILLAALVLLGTMPAVFALGFKSKPLGPRTTNTATTTAGKTSSGKTSSAGAGADWDFSNPCGKSGMWVDVHGEGGLMPIKTCPGDENCKSENYGYKEETRAFNYHVRVTPKKNEKRTMSLIKFTFMPRRDGKVRLSFNNDGHIRHYPPNEKGDIRNYDNWDLYWYCIGDVRIESKGNVHVVNGNFSQRLKNWVSKDVKESKDPLLVEEMIKVKGDIPNGRAFHTYHSLSQVLQVKKDIEITVSFWWATDDGFAALH